MRKIVILLSLLMMTSGLSGCIGDSEVETTDGDEVILELSDDWPTYYVPTSNDLPTCDSTIRTNVERKDDCTMFARRLIQACTSSPGHSSKTGKLLKGGSNANVILNSAPIVTASVIFNNATKNDYEFCMATEAVDWQVVQMVCNGFGWYYRFNWS